MGARRLWPWLLAALAGCSVVDPAGSAGAGSVTLPEADAPGEDAPSVPGSAEPDAAAPDGVDADAVGDAPSLDATEPDAALPDAALPDAARPPLAPPGSPVARHGRLHVVGTEIHDEHDAPFAPHGMSLFWSQWSEGFYDARTVRAIHTEWHGSVVRAALGIEAGGYLDDPAGQEAKIRTVVEAAITEGLYVVIDWHDHDALHHTAEAKDFFARMARDYGQTPNVIFELFSEPEWDTWYEVKQHEEAVLAEIRAAGAPGLVTVGSPHWSQDVDEASTDPIADPNVAYGLHFYAATNGAALRQKAQVAINAGLALFVTEWGTCEASGDGAYDFAESAVWFDFLAAHRIGSINWSLFDKPEAASALVPGASPLGGWAPADLTPSGLWVKAKLATLPD